MTELKDKMVILENSNYLNFKCKLFLGNSGKILVLENACQEVNIR